MREEGVAGVTGVQEFRSCRRKAHWLRGGDSQLD